MWNVTQSCPTPKVMKLQYICTNHLCHWQRTVPRGSDSIAFQLSPSSYSELSLQHESTGLAVGSDVRRGDTGRIPTFLLQALILIGVEDQSSGDLMRPKLWRSHW